MVLTSLEIETLLLIGCFTRQRDSSHQWNAYGDGERGCVIGIDATDLANEVGVAVRTV